MISVTKRGATRSKPDKHEAEAVRDSGETPIVENSNDKEAGDNSLEAGARPEGVTALFDYTYGPFDTKVKISFFMVLIFVLNIPFYLKKTILKQKMVEHECGILAFDEMMVETNTVNTTLVLSSVGLFLSDFVTAICWTRYLEIAGFDQNNSKALKWAVYIKILLGSWIFNDFNLIPKWITQLTLFFMLFVTIIVNFVVDSPERRKKKNLKPVTNN